MPKQESRGTETKRRFSGLRTWTGFVNWLNTTKQDDDRRRVEEFMQNRLALFKNWVVTDRKAWTSERFPGWGPGDQYLQAVKGLDFFGNTLTYKGTRRQWNQEYVRAVKGLRSFLKDYRFRMGFSAVGPRVTFLSLPYSGPGGFYKFENWPPMRWRKRRHPDTGGWILMSHLLHGRGSEIVKIRQCACGCGKWFFRKFSHQQFVSSQCRDRFHKSTPQSREYRRRKAREYYWLHKNRNVK